MIVSQLQVYETVKSNTYIIKTTFFQSTNNFLDHKTFPHFNEIKNIYLRQR